MLVSSVQQSDIDTYVHVSRLPRWLTGKQSACQAGDPEDAGLIPWVDPLEKKVAAHSSILAWETPWTEATSGLQFMGRRSQKVRHNLATKQQQQQIVYVSDCFPLYIFTK